MRTLKTWGNSSSYLNRWYLVTGTQQEGFIKDILDGTLGDYTTNFSTSNYFSNIFLQNSSDYLVSIMYYPIILTPFIDTSITGYIAIGSKHETNYTCDAILIMSSCMQVFSYTATRTYNNYMDYDSYTTFTLHFPYFEDIRIPAKFMYEGITGYLAIDITNGRGTLYIMDSATKKYLIAKSVTQLGIPLPIGQTNKEQQEQSNLLQALSLGGAVVSGAIGAVTGNPIALGGAVAMGTKAVTQYLQNNIDTFQGKPSTGGRDTLAEDETIYITKEYPTNVTRPSVALRGKPCHQTRALGSLSGYTEVGDIHFNSNNEDIYSDEIEEIVSLLKQGVIL